MLWNGHQSKMSTWRILPKNTSKVQQADLGQLRRWVWRGSPIEENTMLLTVGTIHYTSPYYIATFTARDLQAISKSIRLSSRTLIFRTSSDEDEYTSAEWILSDLGEISGIRLAAKAATSGDPWIRICPIDILTCTKYGGNLTVSEGGIPSYKPASPYILPEVVRSGPTINDTQDQLTRTDFKSRTTSAFQVILKSMSNPPLSANTIVTDTYCDYFIGRVSIFNNNMPASMDTVTVASVSALYRMVGDPEYAPVPSFQLLDGRDILPITLEPRHSFLLNFQVAILRKKEDTKLSKRWSNRAFLARNRPIRIKLVVEDMENNHCSLVMEYVMDPFPFEERKETDLSFFFVDDPQTYSRFYCRVRKPPIGPQDNLLEICAERKPQYISTTTLQEIVYRSLKSEETEVDLEIGLDDGRWAWNIWALVDLSCRRVYAFKLMLVEGKAFPVKRIGVLWYFSCPDYGNISEETRPISYAAENVTLPLMLPYPRPKYVQDDDVDDLKPAAAAASAAQNASTSARPLDDGVGISLLIPAEVTNRLNSIDNNLARLADSFERLLMILCTLAFNDQVP